MKICVIGLGYVGLPLASVSSRYFETYGLDVKEDVVAKLQQKVCTIDEDYTRKTFEASNFIATTDSKVIADSEIIVICVPTPVDDDRDPDLRPLKSAAQAVARRLRKGQLVITESTIYPGTTQEVIVPILEESGLKAGLDFGVAYCPERIDPGNARWNLENISRVCAGLTASDAQRAFDYYSKILQADVHILKSIRAAEAVKILENTFRDVNIAFINEMAMSFDRLGIDLHEVIGGAASKPFGFMPFFPGPGVGGHCIPVDPYYLIKRAKRSGFDHNFLDLARKINLSMPRYVVGRFASMLNGFGLPLRGAQIGVLGVAYKRDIDDIRESPSLDVIELLRSEGAQVNVYDPFVSDKSDVSNLSELFSRSDFVILLTNHSEFVQLDGRNFAEGGIRGVYDTRNCLKKDSFEGTGVVYDGIGRGA